VFRKLYMCSEPGCFARAASVFCGAVDHPIGEWVKAELGLYEKELAEPPDHVPLHPSRKPTFTRKRLINAFVYTKFAHQPQKKWIRRYEAMLAEIKSEDMLTWLFQTTAFFLSLYYVRVGTQIGPFLAAYLQAHGASPSFQGASLVEGAGIGTLEKQQAIRDRLLREKAQQLAYALWDEAGRPEGGPTQFLPQAEAQLRRYLGLGQP